MTLLQLLGQIADRLEEELQIPGAKIVLFAFKDSVEEQDQVAFISQMLEDEVAQRLQRWIDHTQSHPTPPSSESVH